MANVLFPAPVRAAAEKAGLSRLDLAAPVWGRLYELHRRDGATPAVLDVLRALLAHANEEHNRVWCSVATLAEEADLSPSTVELALLFLRRVGAIRLLWGDELTEGDGPHRARERGVRRRGLHPVNTYCLAGLVQFLPSLLRRALASAVRALRSLVAPAPPPLLSTATLDTGPPGVSGVGVADHQTRGGQSARRIPPPGRGLPAPENRAQKSGVPRPADYAERADVLAALRGVGLRGPVPSAMLTTMGASWCRELVRYHAWLNRPGEVERGPGYLVQVWKEWRAGNGEWPEAFERAARPRRVVAAPPEPPAAVTVTPPRPPVSGASGGPQGPSGAALALLPASVRERIEAARAARKHQSTESAPSTRTMDPQEANRHDDRRGFGSGGPTGRD